MATRSHPPGRYVLAAGGTPEETRKITEVLVSLKRRIDNDWEAGGARRERVLTAAVAAAQKPNGPLELIEVMRDCGNAPAIFKELHQRGLNLADREALLGELQDRGGTIAQDGLPIPGA